jgi:outer membrane receptor for ferric coprogen and ferric-rhodotorulic acid
MPVDKFLVQVGSDSLYHGMLDYDVAIGPKDDVQYRVVIGYQNSRYPNRNYDYNKVQSIMPSLAIDLNSRSRLTARFEYIHSNQSWSPSVMGLDNKPLPFSPMEDGDRYLDIERTFQTTLTTQINDNWSFKANMLLQTMADDWLYGSMSSAVAQTPQAFYTFTPNKRVYTQKTWYGDATLDWKHDDLGHGFSNDMYFDGNIEYFDENIKWLSNSMLGATPSRANPLINPLAPDLNAMSAQFSYSSTENIPYSTELEPGLSISETFGALNKRLLFVGRSRFNYDARTSEILVNSPANNPVYTVTGAPAVLNTNEKLTNDYGVIFKIMDGWSAYYGHSESYLPVGTGTTYLYQPLATETGKNDEVGSKLDMQIWGGTLTGSTAFFKSDVDNLWIPDPVEAQLGFTNKRFSAVAGFYNADGPYQIGQPATGIQPAGDLRAVWAPKVTYDFWGKYNFFGNFSAGGGYRYQGNAVSSSRLLVSPGFDNIDLFANYVIPLNARRLTFQFTITNVENKLGIMREDNVANVYVEEGRRIALTVSYTW